MPSRKIPAAILGGAIAVLSGCSHSTAPAQSSAAPGSTIDDLIVGVEDARRIAKADGLSSYGDPAVHSPPPPNGNAPEPCQPVGNNTLTFGTGWTEYRSTTYHGPLGDRRPGGFAMVNQVSQAVAQYSNRAAAFSAFGQLETALRACHDLHDPNYPFTLDEPDPSTLRLTATGWSHLYRAKSAVLVSIGAEGLEFDDRIASGLLRMVTDRIR
ncbi:MAG: sensor domain-containing protein [Planctomycetota bacterium]